MKRLILLLVMLANIVSGLFAQTDFFYSENGKEEYFKIRKDKVATRTKSKAETEKLLLQDGFRDMKKMQDDLLIATVDSGTVKVDRLKQLEQREEISDAYYFLEYADGVLQLPTEHTSTFYPFVNDFGGVDCTSAYNPGTGLVEITYIIQVQDVNDSNKVYTNKFLKN